MSDFVCSNFEVLFVCSRLTKNETVGKLKKKNQHKRKIKILDTQPFQVYNKQNHNHLSTYLSTYYLFVVHNWKKVFIFICRSLRNEMSNFLEFLVKTSDNWTFGLKMWEPCTNLKNSPLLFWPTKTEKWHSSKFYFLSTSFYLLALNMCMYFINFIIIDEFLST